jgi:hypothetical protein
MARRSTPSRRTDVERLRHFVNVVDRCVERRAIRGGTLRASFGFSSGVDQPTDVRADLGDPEDVRSFAAEFRKLALQNDDAHFLSICNLVERQKVPHDMREANRSNRTSWQSMMAGAGSVNMVVNGRSAQGEELLNLWLNGEVFHSDPEAERYIEAVSRGPMAPITRPMFEQAVNSMLITGIQIAWAQRNVVEHILTEGSGVADNVGLAADALGVDEDQ